MSLHEMGVAAAVYFVFLAFVCGACAGSFVNCYADRRASGEKLTRGRSRCPACGHTLGVLDLVPLLSRAVLRGKCRYCGAHISARYTVTEAIGAVAFVLAAVRFGFDVRAVEYCLLFALLLAMALVDYDTMELPGVPMAMCAVIWAVFLPFAESWKKAAVDGVIGAFALGGALLVFTLVADKVMKRETMGGGDIKLFFVLGLYSGPGVGLLLVILSCVFGLVFAGVSASKGRAFPFGPAIAAAAVPALLYGPQAVSLYMGLFV